MAFEFYQRAEPDDVDEKDGIEITTKWGFQGTNNYSELRTYVLQTTPIYLTYNGRRIWRKGWRPRFNPGSWGYADVIYSSTTSEQNALQPEGIPGEPNGPPSPTTPTDDQSLDGNWTLSTRGGTVHVGISKQRMRSVKIGGGAADDFGNLIGVTEKGVRGADVPAMKLTASITLPTDLKLPLVRTLARVDEPKTNSRPWLGMDTGEWLYVGCEANGKADGRGSVTINLEGGENLVAGDPRLAITPELTLASKGAHELLDVYYGTTKIGGYVVQKAISVTVHRMFESMNFADVFGFG